MSEVSFTIRHAGATTQFASNITLVHLWRHEGTEVEVIESEGKPLTVCVTKDSGIVNGHDEGMTKVYVDWETAREIARQVDRFRELADTGRHPSALHILSDKAENSLQQAFTTIFPTVFNQK